MGQERIQPPGLLSVRPGFCLLKGTNWGQGTQLALCLSPTMTKHLSWSAPTAVPVEYLNQQYLCFDLCNSLGFYMGTTAG